jgi:hypothetical protein
MSGLPDPWNAPQPENRQFSLLGLFALMGVVCVALAPARYVPPTVFAGILGGVAVLMMAAVSCLRLSGAIVSLAWWCILLLYVMAAVVAASQMPAGETP